MINWPVVTVLLDVFGIWFAGYVVTFTAMQTWRKATNAVAKDDAFWAKYNEWRRKVTQCQWCHGHSRCSNHRYSEPIRWITYWSPAQRALYWPISLTGFLCRETGAWLGNRAKQRIDAAKQLRELHTAQERLVLLETQREVKKLEAELGLSEDT